VTGGTGQRSRSVSFDRAAEYYDETRAIDREALAACLDLLATEFRGRGTGLEIGVGTGVLALPLAEAGIPLVGLDYSSTMLAKLVDKAGGRAPLPLLQGDATALPFGDERFGGAYARWVLHLIEDWEGALAELSRVVRPGGVVMIEPGGYGLVGPWREIWLRMREEVGEAADPIGFDTREGLDELDAAFARHGAMPRSVPEIVLRSRTSVARFLDESERRLFSWTWRIPEDDLTRALRSLRAWAQQRFGDLDRPPRDVHVMQWRAYDLGRDG